MAWTGTDLGDSSMQIRANSPWPMLIVDHVGFVEQNEIFGVLNF